MLRNFLIACALVIIPGFAHAEYIDTFTTDIAVEKDASFSVTETIDYRFSEPRHGIFREIPLIHPEKASSFLKERIIDIDLDSVTMDGEAVPYVLESTKDTFFVRIGDSDKTIMDAHIYTIAYTVRGGLSYPKGLGTEFYWNVTGHTWNVPIRVVSATIHSPDQLFRSTRSCYRGSVGDTTASCGTSIGEDGSVTFRTIELNADEGMTIAQALEHTKVAKDIRERTRIWWLVIPFGILVLIGVGIKTYRWKTRYKLDQPIVVEYEPYPGVKPMYTGLLMDGRLDARDITACIVYLAQQGYIKIRKTEHKVLFVFEVEDYEVSITKELDESVSTFEKRIFKLLFQESVSVDSTVSLKTLQNDLSIQKKNLVELHDLEDDMEKDLIRAGFFEKNGWKGKILLYIVLGIVLSFIVSRIIENDTLFFVTIAIAVITALAGQFFIFTRRRRSLNGYEALDYLKGFKQFLEMTERDRYAFSDVPAKSPEQFMEYLPYAIAFGVEKEWAKVFENIAIPNPGWYDGGTAGSFSSTNLTTSLGAFSTAFASSSGTGGSASSGGGSSGGGAGGGGGGSW